jgi:8-oxo-dGTP pyrophosphatase MutT (NUDIX family)
MNTKEKVSSKIKVIQLFMATAIFFIFNNISAPSTSVPINIPNENSSDEDGSVGGPSSIDSQELLCFDLKQDAYSNSELYIYKGSIEGSCRLIDQEVEKLMLKIESSNKPYNLQVILFIRDINSRRLIFGYVEKKYPKIIRICADKGSFKSLDGLWFAFDPRDGIPKESHKNSSSIVAFVLAKIGDEKFVTVVKPIDKSLFQLPGGFIAPGLSVEESLIKEVEEELGFNINYEKDWLFPKVIELPRIERLNGGTGFVYPFIIHLTVDTNNKYEYFHLFGSDPEIEAKANIGLSTFAELLENSKDREVKFVGEYILRNYDNLDFRNFLLKAPFYKGTCLSFHFNYTA